MKTIDVPGMNADEFVSKVSESLAGRELGKIVSFKKLGNELIITFSKLGTSEIKFQISDKNQGFSAKMTSEKIAFTHKAFRGDIEGKIANILNKLGAQIS